MNAQGLLNLYERVADAPAAVPMLRGFLLDLAARGKLVEQDATDEPASELLKRIAVEKVRLVRNGKFKVFEGGLDRDKDNFPFEIPSNWHWCYLDDIAAVARGGSPRPIKSFITDDSKGIPWIKIGDAARGSVFIDKTQERIKREGLAKSRLVIQGDLLLSNSMSFGHPYITNIEGCIHDGWLVIRTPDGLVDKLFLHTMFLSGYAKATFSEAASGAVVQNLNADKARRLAIPLPPFAEQQRIVSRVEELMALCDRLAKMCTAREDIRDRLTKASYARLNVSDTDDTTKRSDARFAINVLPALTARPDQIKLLRETIRNLAVRGKLVRQDELDEPASALLKRIATQRDHLADARTIRRQKRLTEIRTDEPPFEVPTGWKWSRIGDAVLFTQYGTSSRSSSSESGVPVLTMGNIQDGIVIFRNEKKIPNTADELPALYLKRYDLLYNRTNSADLVGKTGIYLGDDDRRTFASYLIRIRASLKYFNPHFLNLAMNTTEFRKTQIVPLIKKQTGQANVNGTALKNMLIPVPPLPEQHRIVAKVDELMILCDQLKSGLVATNTVRRRLHKANLQELLSRVK